MIGMPSVMQMIRRRPDSAASSTESLQNGAGTKITEASAPVLAHRLGDRIEDRQPQVFGAALAGGHPADQLGTVFEHLLAVRGALGTGKALDR